MSVIVVLVAFAALVIGLHPTSPSTGPVSVSTLTRVLSRHTLRVGYEGYPPYTIKDPSTGKLTGFSVDLAEYIAREAGWTVEWVQTSPDTKIPDLQAGRFDLMTEPIFSNIPRATQVCFTRPYAYFGDGAGIMRKGDKRFKTIQDLNKPGVVIAVRQGYTDQTFAQDNFPLATVRALKVDDASQVFLEVLSGKADITLADVEQVKAFGAAHISQVQVRFADPPPSYIPAGIMLKQGDFTFYNFLNTSLQYLEANGVLKIFDQRYGILPQQLPPAS